MPTLANWPDPQGLFADWDDLDKFTLKTELLPEALDHCGKPVAPTDYSSVYADGVWVLIDAVPFLSVVSLSYCILGLTASTGGT